MKYYNIILHAAHHHITYNIYPNRIYNNMLQRMQLKQYILRKETVSNVKE